MKRVNRIFVMIVITLLLAPAVVGQSYDNSELIVHRSGFKWYRTSVYKNGQVYYGILNEDRNELLEPRFKFVSAEDFAGDYIVIDYFNGEHAVLNKDFATIAVGYLENISSGNVVDRKTYSKIEGVSYLEFESYGTRYVMLDDGQVLARLDDDESATSVWADVVSGLYYVESYRRGGSYGVWVNNKELFSCAYSGISARTVEKNGEQYYYISAEDNSTTYYKAPSGETISNPYSSSDQAFAELKRYYEQEGQRLLASCDYVFNFTKSAITGGGGKLGICKDGTMILYYNKKYRKLHCSSVYRRGDNWMRLVTSSFVKYGLELQLGEKGDLILTGVLGPQNGEVIHLHGCANSQLLSSVISQLVGSNKVGVFPLEL